MTKVTLAKANKIRNYVEDRILPTIEKNIAANRAVTLVGFEDLNTIGNKMADAMTTIKVSLDSWQVFVGVAATLRESIANANRKSVNSLLLKIETKKRELKLLNSINVSNWEAAKTPAEIAALVKYENDQAAGNTNMYSQPARTTRFWVAGPGFDKATYDEKILAVEAELRAFEEQRNQLNYSTMVDLDDSIVTVLAPYHLI